jgi:serine O-acetyltransferase
MCSIFESIEGKKVPKIKNILNTINHIRSDINSVIERDPAAKTPLEVMFLYPSFKAVRDYRIAHWFYRHGHYFLARLISQSSRERTGIEIHPGATIGKGLFIDHGSGVVIGETAEIGDNCTIYQGVTLGGTGKDVGKRHPTLGKNVMVGAGARVLGPFKVGDNVKIAANAVVLKEVPPNCTAVGVPAKIVRYKGQKVTAESGFDLDQIHFDDPVDIKLNELSEKITGIEWEIKEISALVNEIATNCDKLKR